MIFYIFVTNNFNPNYNQTKMKKLLFYLISCSLLFQSCVTIISGTKKNIFLVDLPKDLAVTLDGQPLEIKNQRVGTVDRGGIRTSYSYPGVRVKLKKNMVLKMSSGDKTAAFPLKPVVRAGDLTVAILLDVFFGMGVGLIVDIASGAIKTAKERFVDVPALLEKRTPRSQKEMDNYLIEIGRAHV